MKKRELKFLLVAVAIAVTVVFTAGEVLAFSDNCDPETLDFPIFAEAGPYTIELTGIDNYGIIADRMYYQWNYKITNTGSDDLTGLNLLAMLIPNCCKEPEIEISVVNSHFGNLSVYPVAEGETTIGFGRFIDLGYVIKGVSDGSKFWSLVTTSNTVTLTSAVIKFGKKDPESAFKMPGPGCIKQLCEPPAVRVEPRTQCFEFIAETNGCNGEQPVKSVWLAEWNDPGNPCAADIWAAYEYEGGDEINCGNVKEKGTKIDPKPISTITDENGDTLSNYITNNSQCNEGWLRFTDVEGCNARCYVSGGRQYCF